MIANLDFKLSTLIVQFRNPTVCYLCVLLFDLAA